MLYRRLYVTSLPLAGLAALVAVEVLGYAIALALVGPYAWYLGRALGATVPAFIWSVYKSEKELRRSRTRSRGSVPFAAPPWTQ